MPKLKNPKTGRVLDLSEGQAKVRRRKGWTGVNESSDQTSEPAKKTASKKTSTRKTTS